MLGKPKFKEDEVVKFTTDGEVLTGKIYIIDPYGTFEQNEEVSYDVMVEDGPWPGLFKHLRESWLEKA